MSKSVQDSLESIRGSVNSINWKSVWANPLLLAWISAAVLSVAVPSIQWSVQRSSFYQSYGYAVEYENQQREYEEQQNDDGNNDDVYGSVYESCSSWNWWCIKKQAYYADYYGDGNKDDGDDGGAGSMTFPSWFIFLGGQTENMRRWEEENTGGMLSLLVSNIEHDTTISQLSNFQLIILYQYARKRVRILTPALRRSSAYGRFFCFS
mmetsp:Transcript_27028/g.54004  ORF Transcript_27028/g.54004 Transcript_27028/m.54004 type:complete len:208 (+) Transcript_27028:94-717(+)